MKFLVGAGGFIGGHLVKRLLNLGYEVIAVDNKKLDNWYQIHEQSKNHELVITFTNCTKVTKNVDGIFNLVIWGAWVLLRIIKLCA